MTDNDLAPLLNTKVKLTHKKINQETTGDLIQTENGYMVNDMTFTLAQVYFISYSFGGRYQPSVWIR